MPHQLAELLTERIASSLQRKSIVSAAKWATKYRVMGRPFEGPWTFKRHPWLEGMHNSEYDENIGQKAAQMGYTECVLNIVLFNMDIHGVDCLYILPSKTPDASDFSAARFDTTLELSGHIRRMFSNVKNVGHKRAGNTNLYIRGAKSRSGLKSIPVGVLVLDEKDEMDQTKIPLAKERQSGYDIKITWEISTPTIDNFGINSTFKTSTQNEFFFKCPSCSRLINLTWPESIEIIGEDHDDPEIRKSFIKCNICEAKLPHENKSDWLSTGRWIEQFGDRNAAGWGISQLYSTTIHPSEVVGSYFRAQSDPAEEQEFFNSKLGRPHIVDGAKVNESDIEGCVADYISTTNASSGLITLGVDVGSYLHYEVDRWNVTLGGNGSTDFNVNSTPQVLAVGKARDFEQLDSIMQNFNVGACVIDSQPERRKAFEFASRYWGRVWLCTYARGINGKQITRNSEELSIHVDRTSWLDLSQGRFKSGSIRLPKDLPREYKRHIMSLVRVYEKDSEGNPVGKYVKSGSNDDHFAHSRNYSEMALPLAASLGAVQNITGRL